MAQIGADTEQLDAVAQTFDEAAKRLGQAVASLSSAAQQTWWVGADADRFRAEWSTRHSALLRKLAELLMAIAREIWRQAEQQRGASAADGSSAVPSTGGQGSSTSEPAGHGESTAAGTPGATSGSLPGSDRTWQEIQEVYESQSPGMPKMGLHAFGNPGLQYQCTAWAKFRWLELNPDVEFGTVGGLTGNGHEMAGYNGGTTDTPPTLGAMASYDSEGHVMIVEEVSTDASGRTVIRVSEMNYGDGPGEHPNGYRSDREFVQQDDGSWAFGGQNHGAITFASLPD